MALVAAALVVVLAACSGTAPESEISARPATTSANPSPVPPPPPPPAPRPLVRVVDGDSARPVEGARVTGSGAAVRTEANGEARLAGTEKRRVKVRVSALGYSPRTVRVAVRERRPATVSLWRRATQWPLYGANPARTQAHGGIELRPPFRRVWKRSLHGLLEFPAVVWEGVAYVSTMRGWLRAISMRNGRVLWKRRVGTLMASSPGIDPERRVLVVTTMSPGDAKVVDMDTGRVRWRFAGGTAESSPLVRNGVAYFGAASGNVYALDLEKRRPRWVFRGGVKITASLALAGNRLFFGDYAGRVFALNARTGRRIWTGSAGSRVYGTAAVSGGRVFVPSVFSGLSALSARTGKLLWRVPVGAYLYSSPAVFRGRAYFGTHGGYVYCVGARSGRILWTRAAGGRVSGAVQVVAGVLYAATLNGSTSGWNWRTGRRVFSFPEGTYVPISGNGERLLLHGRREIWAVEPKRGR